MFKRMYQGRNIWDDPIIEKSQDQDQGQGQGQDQKLRQRSALRQQMVLALTLVLVLRFFNYRVAPDIQPLISSLEFFLVNFSNFSGSYAKWLIALDPSRNSAPDEGY